VKVRSFNTGECLHIFHGYIDPISSSERSLYREREKKSKMRKEKIGFRFQIKQRIARESKERELTRKYFNQKKE